MSAAIDSTRDLADVVATIAGRAPDLNLHRVEPDVARSIVEATIDRVTWKAEASGSSEWLMGQVDGVRITLFLNTRPPEPVQPKPTTAQRILAEVESA